MKMSPLTLYCEECGAANTAGTTVCFACQEPLSYSETVSAPPSVVLPTPFPSSTSGGQLLPGSLLNQRYEIIREVGQGGFSVVYAAKDTQQKYKLVAVKQINLRAMKPRQIIEATDTYNREVRLLSRLHHASLPRIHDHFTDADRPDHWYLVMDFIEGETLEDYVEKTGPLPVKEVLEIGIQLCKVLQYLHGQAPPVIFRDVKPSNIMRTPEGRLYLIDFGIARYFMQGKNRDTGPLGSPGYAAPEQYGTAQTTARADIYSLGATLEALLSGQDPLDSSPTPGQPLPKKLRKLLDKMLAHDARTRPPAIKVRLRLKDMQQGMRGRALSFLWGLLIGTIPYPLLVFLLFTMSSFPQFNAFTIGVYFVFLCTWPFMLVAQLIVATRFLLFPSPRRWMGLGILAMLALLATAILLGWLPSPIFSRFFRILD